LLLSVERYLALVGCGSSSRRSGGLSFFRRPVSARAVIRSGASRSSSPAMPTSVNRAYVSAAPIRCGVAVSAMEHIGQSDVIHSPEACARTVLSRTIPWSARWRSHVGSRSCARCRARSRAGITEGPLGSASLFSPNSADQGFFRIDEPGLGFGQGRGDRANTLARALHDYPPPQGDQS
jgi:hypothetical protein